MSERDKGLYYPDGSFRTEREVKRKVLAEELVGSRRLDIVQPHTRDFEAWTEVITRQQQDRKELLGIPEAVTVEIETTEPILVALMGDVHGGGADVDYERFAEDVKLIREAKGYTIAVGDLTDSFFFMPEVGEQLISGDEQVLYMQSALDELAEDDRLLAAWGGDHDMWSRDKSGAHTLYAKFQQTYNAHYLEGVSYLTVNLNDGAEITPVKFTGSHRHRGYSLYHATHAGIRQENYARGTDVSFTAHMHEKGHLSKLVKNFGGEEQRFHSIALGTYKESDRWSRKLGWARKDPEQMGAFGLVLKPGSNDIEVHWTVEQALDSLT